MVDTQTVEYRGYIWQYPDTELMQRAALGVFREMFSEADVANRMRADRVLLAKIQKK